MNIADEGTTAHLKAFVQNCVTVSSMNEQAIVQLINSCFQLWGLPKNIKIDNGHPFVTPAFIDLPTKSKLWWIGLGINVIQNDLGCPQQNGAVECLQGIMKNWSNPKIYENMKQLQHRLDDESDFQRNHYRIPAKENKTRSELYPDLFTNPRKYHPDNFDIQLVYQYLSQQVWKRKINAGGKVNFMNNEIYISYKYKQIPVDVTFNPIEKKWIIRKEDGTMLKKSNIGIPNEEQIKDFAIMSKNF